MVLVDKQNKIIWWNGTDLGGLPALKEDFLSSFDVSAGLKDEITEVSGGNPKKVTKVLHHKLLLETGWVFLKYPEGMEERAGRVYFGDSDEFGYARPELVGFLRKLTGCSVPTVRRYLGVYPRDLLMVIDILRGISQGVHESKVVSQHYGIRLKAISAKTGRTLYYMRKRFREFTKDLGIDASLVLDWFENWSGPISPYYFEPTGRYYVSIQYFDEYVLQLSKIVVNKYISSGVTREQMYRVRGTLWEKYGKLEKGETVNNDRTKDETKHS